MFDHLIELHPGFYETNRSSEIQVAPDRHYAAADGDRFLAVDGLRNALMLVGGVLLMVFVTNAKLTSIVVLALPLVIAPILLFGRRAQPVAGKPGPGGRRRQLRR